MVSLGADTLATFKQGLYLFLDVETGTPCPLSIGPGGSRASPALGFSSSRAFTAASSAGGQTWSELRRAATQYKAPCAGIGGAYYKSKTPVPVPAWTDDDTQPQLEDGSRFTDVPVLAWQYCGDYRGFDVSLIQPDRVDEVLCPSGGTGRQPGRTCLSVLWTAPAQPARCQDFLSQPEGKPGLGCPGVSLAVFNHQWNGDCYWRRRNQSVFYVSGGHRPHRASFARGGVRESPAGDASSGRKTLLDPSTGRQESVFPELPVGVAPVTFVLKG